MDTTSKYKITVSRRNGRPTISIVRSENGISIPIILVVGVVAMMMMQAVAGVVIPIYQKISSTRLTDQMRASCESILDYTVQQLNSGGTGRATFDTGNAIDTSGYVTLANSSFKGSVVVKSTPAPTYSYLYDQYADASNPTSYAGQGGMANGWRVVTATVTNALGLQKKVCVILKPIYDTGTKSFTTSSTSIITSTSVSTSTSTTTGTPQPIFNFVLYAAKGVSGSGNFKTQSYRSSHTSWGYANVGGDVGTGAAMTLSGNATVGGNLVTYNSGSNVTMSGNATVNGQIRESGTYSSSGNAVVGNQMFTSTDSSSSSTAPTVGNITTSNQSASINGSAAGSGGSTNVNGVAQNVNQTPPALPQVPSAPTGATNLGTLSLSGNKTQTISQPGSYIVNSISMSGNASINVTASGPVDIYIQGTGSNNGFSISGNGMMNSSGIPSNVRIWYGGTGNVSLSGNGDFVGTIFAPNANVSVSGNGNIKGAVIGNTISASGNGAFYYDRDLGKGTSVTWTPTVTVTSTSVSTSTSITTALTTTTTTVDTAIQYLQVVSWTEY